MQSTRHKTHDDPMVSPTLLDCHHLPSFPVDCLQRKAGHLIYRHDVSLVCLKEARRLEAERCLA
jgi:hypothetical protein